LTEVINVKFKSRGKTYFFAPNGIEVPDGAQVVVETSKGLELADCVKGNNYVTDERIVPPLRPVVRVATADDLRIAELCKAREKEAFTIAEQKIAQHGLDMKLVDVECNFEGNKILFFFTSDGRVDFRDLVKDLAGIFRTRIELRQIGVRDEAKLLGGLGICGRPFCCNQFLDDFQPVSTKMAKVQSLSLNPTKISGACGRLMCCLRYEQEAYEDLVKTVPKNGAFVETPSGYGNVAQVNLLRQKVKVHIDGDDSGLKSFDADEVAAVPGGRPKPGEPLPHVLKLKVKTVEPEEPEDDGWHAPSMFGELRGYDERPAPGEQREAPQSDAQPGEEKKKHRRPRHKKPAGERPGSGEGGTQGTPSGENLQEKHPPKGEKRQPGEKGKHQDEQSQRPPRRPKPENGAAADVEQRERQQSPAQPGDEKKKHRRPRHKKPAGERPETGEAGLRDGSRSENGDQRGGAPRDGSSRESGAPGGAQHEGRVHREPRPPKPEGAQSSAAPAASGDAQKKRRHRRFRGPAKQE
jgi:cell fate regulator YaaT (PSP1 superfamily)